MFFFLFHNILNLSHFIQQNIFKFFILTVTNWNNYLFFFFGWEEGINGTSLKIINNKQNKTNSACNRIDFVVEHTFVLYHIHIIWNICLKLAEILFPLLIYRLCSMRFGLAKKQKNRFANMIFRVIHISIINQMMNSMRHIAYRCLFVFFIFSFFFFAFCRLCLIGIN